MMTWLAQHRFLVVGIVATVLAATVVAGVGVWFFVLRSPGTRVGLSQALRMYHRDQSAEPADGTRLAPSGVYRYRTTGGEQLSIGGISRSFPPVTDMVVTDGSCADEEWDPLVEHREGLVECSAGDGALRVAAALSYEDIAGTQTTSRINCPAGTFLVPPHPVPGRRWHTTCRSAGHPVGITGEVVGPSSVVVGGHPVPALHTRLTLRFSGSESGTNPNDYWISADGMVLRQRETVDVSQAAGPLGAVRYTERMAITLESLQPVR